MVKIKLDFASKWSMLVILLMIFFSRPTHSISPDQKDQINTGLELAKGIAELFEKEEFRKSLTKIAKDVGPYLGVLGPFIGVVLAFIPSESDELFFMKNMMTNIDNRLDKMDTRFNNIERLIQWDAVAIKFAQLEQKINAVSREFQFIYKVRKGAVENRKLIFTVNYDGDYQNSGSKLYDAIVEKHGTFQEDLGTSVLRYTDNDRNKTQVFLLGVMKILLRAVKIELGYLLVKGFTINAEFMKSDWEKRIQEVTAKFEQIDDQCANVNYRPQSGKEIDAYALTNSDKTNNEFATGLFNLLSGKYYWRDWVVLAYDPITGRENHWVGVDGGHVKIGKNGRNIVVASVDKSHAVLDLARARQRMEKVAETKRDKNWWGISKVYRTAKEIWNALDRKGASFTCVVRSGKNAYFHFHSRKVTFVQKKNFQLMMWG
ncbi:uncharacterized protein LOC134728324 [Mytilus trossulus]|uniref:uncharacterized protein LOC134728324 n=1 Tax=Mytilus trossulus TaxID=6551 RepID=UPI003003FD23